jgi:uracil-DNA glycosylase family 4
MNINKEFIACNCNKQDCPYFTTCDRLPTEIIRHQDRVGIDILISGMGSGKTESELKIPFCGRSGKYMREVILHLWNTFGIFNIAMSNNVRFHPIDEFGKDRPPTKEEISRCISLLEVDIDYLQPKIIMPVGKNAINTFKDFEEESVGAIRGRPFLSTKLSTSYNCIGTWHPSFLCRSYGRFDCNAFNLYDNQFIKDIKSAVEFFDVF